MDHTYKKRRIDQSLDLIESVTDDHEQFAHGSLEMDNFFVQSEEHDVNRTKEPVEDNVQSKKQAVVEETDNHSCHEDKLIEQVFLFKCNLFDSIDCCL